MRYIAIAIAIISLTGCNTTNIELSKEETDKLFIEKYGEK